MNRPRVVAAAIVAATVLVESSVFAATDEREQCAASAEQAQQFRDEGKYRRAREQMLVCAREACPGPIKSDCGKWLTELDRDAPTVVFVARDNKGSDVVDVRVSIDGAPIQERLDGKPVLVDSGEHTFRFESNDGAIKEDHVLIRAAEKARPIVVTFSSGSDAAGDNDKSDGSGAGDKDGLPQTSPPKGSVIPALVVGGVGVAALGSFAVFGVMGKSSVDDLQKCKPTCQETDVDSARTKLLIADVSLGVGVAALGVATYLFLTRPTVDTSKVQTATQKGGLRVDGGPVVGGGYAGVAGSF